MAMMHNGGRHLTESMFRFFEKNKNNRVPILPFADVRDIDVIDSVIASKVAREIMISFISQPDKNSPIASGISDIVGTILIACVLINNSCTRSTLHKISNLTSAKIISRI